MYYKDYNQGRRRVSVDLYLSSTGVDPAASEAGGQPQISKNGAAPGNGGLGVLVAVDAAKGKYYTECGTADLDTLGTARIIYDSANTVPFDVTVPVEPNAMLDDGTAQAGASTSITLRAGASAVNDAYTDAVVYIIGGLGANQQRGILGYTGASKIATVDQNWTVTPDNTSVYVVLASPKPTPLDSLLDATLNLHIGANTFGAALQPIRSGVAQAGGASTITLDSGASAIDGFYTNQIIQIVTGAGAGGAAICTAYVGSTKVATINGSWAVAPNNTSNFVVRPLGAIPGATAPTATQVADAVYNATIASYSGAGSAGKFLQDQLDQKVSTRADKTEYTAGRAALLDNLDVAVSTRAAPGANMGLTTAGGQVAADRLLVRNIYGGSDGFPSVAFGMAFLSGRWTRTGNVITVMAADDVTPIGTIAVTTAPSDAISGINSSP